VINVPTRSTIAALVVACLVGACVLGGATVLSAVKHVPLGNLTRDPANTLEYPWYFGAVSYFGVLMWCATASLCLFSSIVMSGSPTFEEPRKFLLAAGLLSAALLFDDLFLFHEIVFPEKLHIPELLLYAVYGASVLLILVFFRTTIARTDYLILIAAGAFLGLSEIADTLTNFSEDTSAKFLIEDGLKFMGIVNWFTYFVRTTHLLVGDALAGSRAR
jgi:hypothetical protein